jgi:hypothetical protein
MAAVASSVAWLPYMRVQLREVAGALRQTHKPATACGVSPEAGTSLEKAPTAACPSREKFSPESHPYRQR